MSLQESAGLNIDREALCYFAQQIIDFIKQCQGKSVWNLIITCKSNLYNFYNAVNIDFSSALLHGLIEAFSKRRKQHWSNLIDCNLATCEGWYLDRMPLETSNFKWASGRMDTACTFANDYLFMQTQHYSLLMVALKFIFKNDERWMSSKLILYYPLSEGVQVEGSPVLAVPRGQGEGLMDGTH